MLWSRWKCEVIGSFSARTSCARQFLCDIKVTVRHPGVVLCAGSRPSQNFFLDNVGGILGLSGVRAVFLAVSVSTTGEALTRKYLGPNLVPLGTSVWRGVPALAFRARQHANIGTSCQACMSLFQNADRLRFALWNLVGLAQCQLPLQCLVEAWKSLCAHLPSLTKS